MQRKNSRSKRRGRNDSGSRKRVAGRRNPPSNTARTRAGVAGKSRAALSGATVRGRLITRRGDFGFARIEDSNESAYIGRDQIGALMRGDLLELRLRRDGRDRLSAEVLQVLERGTTSFLGTVEIEGRGAFVRAVDRRLGLRAVLSPAQLQGCVSGDWAIARITRYPQAQRLAQASIVRRVDPENALELAYAAAGARYELPGDFAGEVLAAAEHFGSAVDPNEVRRRRDLRSLPLVTIDGADARDFDDAVFAEANAGGFRLVVAIADVSYYVRPGSELDREAQARGTSIYFPERVIPMLPAHLSDGLCSLKPDEDRLCMVAEMQVSRGGKLTAAEFYPGVMRSHARLTYDEVHAALFERKTAARDRLGMLVDALEPLVEVYRALLKARRARGALEFEAREAKFRFDSARRLHAIELRGRNEAHCLIEECMILANVAVAQRIARSGKPGIYRVHPQPDADRLDNLLQLLAALGLPAELPEEVRSRDLKRLVERLGKRPERPFVETQVIRSMAQAVYQPQNIGHFGLVLGAYTHFTSPIRRYPDLIVHRILRSLLTEDDPQARRYSAAELAAAGTVCSELEKRADGASRYVDTFLKCHYLVERIGQTFDGLITSVVEFGCFVELLELGVDGLLHLDTFDDRSYQMHASGHAWISPGSRRELAMGQHLRVRVLRANPVEGQIDLELA
ncbi:MAG: ribonuclease R [Steroidobacteraceae bacterium]